MMRIGGEFEIEAAMLSDAGRTQSGEFYSGRYQLWTDSGRSALYIALCNIIARGGTKEAWLPVFCCESVLLPFLQLGFTIRYYSMGSELNHFQIPLITKQSTFLFINYFGFRNRPVYEWLSNYGDRQNIFVIEDNVQATLSSGLSCVGDYIVNSFRKVVPQPDGAIVASDQSISFELGEADEEFISKRVVSKQISCFNEEEHLALVQESEARLDGFIQPKRVSWFSRYLFDRTDFETIRQIRRCNWIDLLEQLRGERKLSQFLQPLFDRMEEDEVPLGFPIVVNKEHRDRLRSFLIRQQIFCPIHWRMPKIHDFGDFGNDLELSERIMTLPIDQRMGKDHIRYMTCKLSDFFAQLGE